jgi:intracellular proteinase inhibitor BsuPI
MSFEVLRMRLALCLGALLGVVPACAGPDYFPLQVGNQWIYRGSGIRAAETITLEVTQAGEFDSQTYYLLEGLGESDHWLRMGEDGALLRYDPEKRQEEVWYRFGAPDGEKYNTTLPGVCCGSAEIANSKAEYHGPVGWFDYGLEVRYPGTFQVGIDREVFLPYVGLVYRGQGTGGPGYAHYDLIYARLGGVTHVSEPELSFGLTLDRALYTIDLMPSPEPRKAPNLTARLTLRNTGLEPAMLVFPSGQDFDLLLRNDKGEVVYQWSAGKFFPEAIRRVPFGPGEKNFALSVPLTDKEGKPLTAGRYVAEAWLATQPRSFDASVAFEIIHAF